MEYNITAQFGFSTNFVKQQTTPPKLPRPPSSFSSPIQQTYSGLYYKTITIVIYNHYDSGQYYNTIITIIIDDTSLSLCHQLRSQVDTPNCGVT